MLAVDTNVVVRFLTKDHTAQAKRARDLIDRNDIGIGLTVLLETEWVLRSAYGCAPDAFIQAIKTLGGLPRVQVESAPAVAQALAWHGQGMDFAEALHIASTRDCEALVSFDLACVRVARRLGLPARTP